MRKYVTLVEYDKGINIVDSYLRILDNVDTARSVKIDLLNHLEDVQNGTIFKNLVIAALADNDSVVLIRENDDLFNPTIRLEGYAGMTVDTDELVYKHLKIYAPEICSLNRGDFVVNESNEIELEYMEERLPVVIRGYSIIATEAMTSNILLNPCIYPQTHTPLLIEKIKEEYIILDKVYQNYNIASKTALLASLTNSTIDLTHLNDTRAISHVNALVDSIYDDNSLLTGDMTRELLVSGTVSIPSPIAITNIKNVTVEHINSLNAELLMTGRHTIEMKDKMDTSLVNPTSTIIAYLDLSDDIFRLSVERQLTPLVGVDIAYKSDTSSLVITNSNIALPEA